MLTRRTSKRVESVQVRNRCSKYNSDAQDGYRERASFVERDVGGYRGNGRTSVEVYEGMQMRVASKKKGELDRRANCGRRD